MPNKVTTVVATIGYGPDTMVELSYMDTKVIGQGSFGVVFTAKMLPSGEQIAIKKVLQDRRFKNRELQIMRKLKHPNIINLRYFFYSSGEKREEVFLNLVMDCMPDTLYKVERQFARSKQTLPVNYIRLYMYQLFRGLAYMHSYGFCHRDIKPQNMLLDSETGIFKLCDFGSAKQLVPGETNVSYICSRYYRSPELIFGAVNYTTKIDMWSAGCVLAELLLGQLIFPGDSGVDQIVEIVKVMGTPTAQEMQAMNPNYKQMNLPQLKPHPWPKVFRIRTPPEAIDLVSKLLTYTPTDRLSPLMSCAHPFFDELRQDPNQQLPSGRRLPQLFDFSDYEKTIEPKVMPLLQPSTSFDNAEAAAANRRKGGEELKTKKDEVMQKPNKSTVQFAKPNTSKKELKPETMAPGLGGSQRLEIGNGDHVEGVFIDNRSSPRPFTVDEPMIVGGDDSASNRLSDELELEDDDDIDDDDDVDVDDDDDDDDDEDDDDDDDVEDDDDDDDEDEHYGAAIAGDQDHLMR